MNLQNIQNLTYQPSYPPAFRTNQTGVKYTVESIGSYAGQSQENYIANNSLDPKNYVTITDGVMEIIDGTFLSQSAYVIKVKATSIYHDGSEDENDVISALFDVFVVEANNSSYKPTAYFVEDGESTTVEVQEINIYSGNDKYSSSVIDLSLANLSSVYANGVSSVGSTLKYEEYIEVFDKAQNKFIRLDFDDASTTEDIGGLLVSYVSDGRYSLSVANLTDKTNQIKIGYEISGLDFSGTQKPLFEKTLTVNKGLLPYAISLNDSDETSGDIYVSSNYSGYALNVKAVPNDGTSRQIQIRDENSAFTISDANGALTNYTTSYGTTTYTISNNTTIYVKFNENVSSSAQKLIFITANSPSSYNGRIPTTETISKEFTFNKKVTADKIEFVKDKNGNALDGNINLNATDLSYLYIRLTYRATAQNSLNEDTITLKSKNSNVKFANGLNEIELNRDMYVNGSTVSTTDSTTSIYQIPFAESNSVQTGEIVAEAGKGTIGVSARSTVKTVYLMVNKNIKIIENNNNVKTFTTRDNGSLTGGDFYFAVARGTFVEFEVLDGNNNSNTIQKIELNKISDLGSEYTTMMNPTILQPNIFTLSTSGTQTQVMKLTISYYTKDDNNEIVLETEDRYVEIAVYNPISSISLTASKTKMANFEGYNESAVSFNAFASSISSPITNSICFTNFTNNVKIENVNQLQISFDGVNLENNSDMIAVTDESNKVVEGLFTSSDLSGVLNVSLL